MASSWTMSACPNCVAAPAAKDAQPWLWRFQLVLCRVGCFCLNQRRCCNSLPRLHPSRWAPCYISSSPTAAPSGPRGPDLRVVQRPGRRGARGRSTESDWGHRRCLCMLPAHRTATSASRRRPPPDHPLSSSSQATSFTTATGARPGTERVSSRSFISIGATTGHVMRWCTAMTGDLSRTASPWLLRIHSAARCSAGERTRRWPADFCSFYLPS